MSHAPAHAIPLAGHPRPRLSPALLAMALPALAARDGDDRSATPAPSAALVPGDCGWRVQRGDWPPVDASRPGERMHRNRLLPGLLGAVGAGRG